MIALDQCYGTVTISFGELDTPPALFDGNCPTEEQIRRLEAAIPLALPTYNVESLTSHHFCEGLYARELLIPKGGVIVGKKHAKENLFLLAKGDMTIWTEHGMKRVKAPFMVVTKPGDKRVGYAHEDSVTINFHANPDDNNDLELLEARYIIPEPPITLAHTDSALLENME